MHLRTYLPIVAAAAAFSIAGAAHAADVITANSTPAANWHFGSGNDYTPSNTLVLTTDAGDELDLRFHQTFIPAPASVGDVYTFALGTSPISFDWGVDDKGSPLALLSSATITVSRIGFGSFTYDPFASGNDNSNAGTSAQNSARLVWFPITFDSSVDSTYKVTLTLNGVSGGAHSLTAYAKVGAGAGIPEPAGWSLMIAGFGLTGGLLRLRRKIAPAA